MMGQIFNEVLRQKDCTPEAWRRVRLNVICKKGDVEEAGNYRPNCTLPELHTLLSTLLFIRLYPRLDRGQPVDQGGFRRSYETVDHLATYRMLEHRCRQWGIKMRVAIVDFAKVFDTIRHKSLWSALEQFGIEPQYINLLRRLYADQKATVLTDKESDVFEIKRGTKQGEPLNSSLFNTVLLTALTDHLKRWREKGKGIRPGEQQADCSTNTRFEDDLLLFSASLKQLRGILCDFKINTESVGLKIHPDKTNILSNQRVLPVKECAKYLGQTVSFEQQETPEIKSRIRAAWAPFHKFKLEPTSTSYRLRYRLRLFNMVITPTLTYASGEENYEEKGMKIDEEPKKTKEKDAEDKDSYQNSEEMTDEGRSSNTERDHDSVVSFMKDTDEELDTAEIEEEDWAEYFKKKHERSRRTDEASPNPMLDRTTQKNEMAISDENSIAT